MNDRLASDQLDRLELFDSFRFDIKDSCNRSKDAYTYWVHRLLLVVADHYKIGPRHHDLGFGEDGEQLTIKDSFGYLTSASHRILGEDNVVAGEEKDAPRRPKQRSCNGDRLVGRRRLPWINDILFAILTTHRLNR